MKYIYALVLLFQSLFCLANSASPFFAGTNSGSAYSSKNVDILSEKILLDLEKQADKGFYSITYYIHTDKDGKQIPLLFNAMGYADGFKVWVDGKPVAILVISRAGSDSLRTVLKDFGNVYGYPVKHDSHLYGRNPDTIFNDYKYFEALLSKGEHTIRVEYTASPGGTFRLWVKRYDFDYSLWPASFWRSFGSLEIELHADSTKKQLETNLGAPATITADTQIWKFDKLPVDVFRITYTPKVNWLAEVLMSFGPFGLTLVFAACMFIVHIIAMIGYRKSRPQMGSSSVVHLGGFFIPLLVIFFFFFSYSFIGFVIGKEAGEMFSAYVILGGIVLFAIFMPVYWLVVYIIDSIINKRLKSKKAG